MGVPGSAAALLLTSFEDSGFRVKRSLRFNQPDSPRLSRTPSSNGNRRTFTISAWVKKSRLAVTQFQNIVSAGNASPNNQCNFHFDQQGRLSFYNYPSGGVVTSAAKFRDFGAWMHCVASIDTTQSSASNRVKIFVNNTQITDFSSSSYPSQNQELRFNRTTDQINVGANGAFNSHFFSGYIAEVHYIDGQALLPTDFGEYDADTGDWNPIDCKDNLTYGTNGAYLKLENNSSQAALGTDSSGNNNTFSVHNLTVAAFDVVGNSSHVGPGNLTQLRATSGYNFIDIGSDGVTSNPGSGALVRINFAALGLTAPATVTFNSYQQGGGGWGTVSSNIYTDAGTVTSSYTSSGNTRYNTVNIPSGATYFELPGSYNAANSLYYNGITNLVWGGVSYAHASPSGIDSLVDTPTNYKASPNNGGNYCVLNPYHGDLTLSNGNLDATAPGQWDGSAGTILISSGKFYWEIDNVIGDELVVGIVQATVRNPTWNNTYGYGAETGVKYLATNGVSYGAAWTTGDVIGIAFDADNGSLTFYKNGVSQGVAATGLTDGPYCPSVVINGSSRSCSVNFGQRAFTYTNAGTNRPAATYLSVCTENLPDPAIANPSTAFDVLKWDGNGSNPRTFGGLSMSPDFVWLVNRSDSGWGYSLYDQVRGHSKRLVSNSADGESTNDSWGYLSGFTSDGFTVTTGGNGDDRVNDGPDTYVGWLWNAGENSSKTYTVKVVSDGGNKYRFDNFGTSAVTLDLEEGSTYVFDQSDSSNSGHPIRFGTSANGTNYTTGVTHTGTPGSAGAKTTLVLGTGVPTLYYSCQYHSGMGGQINTNSTAGASNFDGSIQSTVKANQSSGFSIVQYTGSSSAVTVGHGLQNKTPLMIMVKDRFNGFNWQVAHIGLTPNESLLLNKTDQKANYNAWNNTRPTNTVFSLGAGTNGVNTVGSTMIAMVFAPVNGFSSVGTYPGNNSADGTFVPLPFAPKWVMVKGKHPNGLGWRIWDAEREPFNPKNRSLSPNDTRADDYYSSDDVDFLSNGFKLRANGTFQNGNFVTYTYIAFARSPFKTARAF